MQVSAANLFPDEIVFQILHGLDPFEVIQLRLVSKQFNAVTRDARLWRAFYTHSHLLLPPGPFLWQSTQFLERVLIHSARVAQTWTSQPINIVSRTRGPRIPLQPSPISTSFDLLFGRLFIWCEGEQLFAQDLETGVGRLLWESTEPISSLCARSLALAHTERIFIALRHIDEPIALRTPIKLLEFPLQDDARLMLGPVIFEMDLPEYANFPLSAKAPFLYFDGGTERLFSSIYERTVIDTRTWTMYKFPAFSSGIDWEHVPWCSEFTLLSPKHIVVFSPTWDLDAPMTLIQAFIVPDPSTQPSGTNSGLLRLTHEVLVSYSHGRGACLRGAIVDSGTGDVNIRFLVPKAHLGQTHLLAVDLTIPPNNAASTEILPMSVRTQELLVLSGRIRKLFFDASSDGHGRGVATMSLPPFSEEPADPVPLALYKFAIDASREQCTATVSEPSTLSAQDVFRYPEHHIFDGIRGRICHNLETSGRYSDLMVLDLQ